METPTNLQFTDFDVSIETLFRRALTGPMNRAWTRVEFSVPDAWEANKAVEKWLTENTPGRWATTHYSNPRSKENSYTMVVRFEDKNDALMFKLRGGHQAWEVR